MLLKKLVNLSALLALACAPLTLQGATTTAEPEDVGQIAQQIQDSKGLIVRVPIDQAGQGSQDQAEYRMVVGEDVDVTAEGIASAFARAYDISNIPRLDDEGTPQPEFFPGLALLGFGLGLAAARPYFYGPRWGYYGYGRPFGYYPPVYYPYYNYGYYYYPPYRPWY